MGPGEIFGLLGHNGAGKTSAMKIIIAEEIPTEGNVGFLFCQNNFFQTSFIIFTIKFRYK